LNQLRAQGAEVLAIACNTLHNFLDPDQDREDLIHLPRMLREELGSEEMPLVFCTTTCSENHVHRVYFECCYPEPSVQLKVDEIIDRILQGAESLQIVADLLALIEQSNASTVILGCTELSLFAKELVGSSKKIIDPLEILAQKIIETSFKNRSLKC
jgi:aspartate racemase